VAAHRTDALHEATGADTADADAERADTADADAERADTADADAERADTDAGRRTSTPDTGHGRGTPDVHTRTLDTGRVGIARADTGRSHRTPDTGR
jgi:hypothetical protein